MKFKIDIKSRKVNDKLAEITQILYVKVSSVTATLGETIYFVKKGKVLSEHWWDTKNLELISRSGQGVFLRFIGIVKRYDEFTESVYEDEERQEIEVAIEVVNNFPLP